MAPFAQRMGYRQARSVVQVEELDEDTRTEVWNTLVRVREVFEQMSQQSYATDSTESGMLTVVWTEHFKRALDEMGSSGRVWGEVKAEILRGVWFDALSLLELVVDGLARHKTALTNEVPRVVRDEFNDVFERNLVGYRFIEDQLAPLDSAGDAKAVVTAQTDAEEIAGVRRHLRQAVDHLSDRDSPDYPNSIKEAISAVEAVSRRLTGAKTLSGALKELESAGLKIHPAIRLAWEKMYSWSSDESGIRHGHFAVAETDQAMAKYVLITCSAFVSYLIEQGRKSGLL